MVFCTCISAVVFIFPPPVRFPRSSKNASLNNNKISYFIFIFLCKKKEEEEKKEDSRRKKEGGKKKEEEISFIIIIQTKTIFILHVFCVLVG